MISYNPNFISKYLGHIAIGAVLGLVTIATLTSLPFESPNYVVRDYSCGKIIGRSENARTYDFIPTFPLSVKNYNLVRDIARRNGLFTIREGSDIVDFFNAPGEDGLLRSTVIPTDAVNRALEEICNAMDNAA